MKKINIDGLLSLNLEEIEIVYRRCRGESVRKAALEMGKVESTFWNVRIPKIVQKLGVEKWEEVEAELCESLTPIIPSLQALKGGWPERFREKIEALRDPSQPLETTSASVVESPVSPPSELESRSEQTSSSESASNTSSSSTSETSESTGGDSTPARSNRLIWPLIAIPLLVVCLLCISAALFLWRNNPLNQGTQTPTLQVPTDTIAPPPITVTSSPTNTDIVTETSLPTSTPTPLTPTATSAPTATPQPTLSPTSSVPALFSDDFNNGKSPLWQVLYGSEPVIVNGALNFNDLTLMVVESTEWTDYEVHFWVSNMQCQQHVGSRGLTIGVRVQNANNMVGLRLNDQDDCAATWMIMQIGEWTEVPNSTFKLPPVDANGGRNLVVRVQGNEFSSPIGTSVIVENFPTGGIAFLGSPAVIIDNVAVIPTTP
jgi:hypothetical protein